MKPITYAKNKAPTLRGLGDPEYDNDLPRRTAGGRPLSQVNTNTKTRHDEKHYSAALKSVTRILQVRILVLEHTE